MPNGSKAIPAGISCLTTLKFGKGRRQVTCRGHRLCTFTSDSGPGVNGDGVAGSAAAAGDKRSLPKVAMAQPPPAPRVIRGHEVRCEAGRRP